MAAGHWNGHNHGGLHTGTGKHTHGGVYSTNGVRKKTVPHREFTVGKRVAYIGRHKDFQGLKGEGVLISKQGDTMKTSRSLLKVNLTDGRNTYFRKEQLVFL